MLVTRRRTHATSRMLGRGELEFFATGRAPCVVAFHGFGGTAAELRPILEAIAGSGRAVDGALLAGHGTVVEELQDMTFEDWVGPARQRMLAAIELHREVVLLGFSLGSLIAMYLASEQRPGLVGLVVLGNALTLGTASSLPLGLWIRAGWPMPDLYLLKPRAGDLVDVAHESELVTYDRHPMRAALEVYRAGVRVSADVARIQCPTLILHGRKDHVCPWKNATWLAAHVGTRDVTVRLFERSAHVLAWDLERDEVAAEILAFLARAV
jgi:carboxylesterase